jgi:hypothetical protein
LKKKVKWLIVQLFARKLRHSLKFRWKIEEKLMKDECRNKSFEEGKIVHIF